MTIHTPLPEDRYTDEDVEAGAAFLDEIHSKLGTERKRPFALPPMNHPLGYMRGDNIRAVIVQQRNGGWVADVLFRDVPQGCPESFGTADASPFGTRRAARKAAVKLVQRLLKQPVPAETIAWMIARMPDCGPPMLIGNQIIFSAYQG